MIYIYIYIESESESESACVSCTRIEYRTESVCAAFSLCVSECV